MTRRDIIRKLYEIEDAANADATPAVKLDTIRRRTAMLIRQLAEADDEAKD